MPDPTYGNDLQSSTLDDLVLGVAYDNFFIDDPKLEWMRTIGAVNPFDGGVLKRYPTIMNRPMGGAAVPGTTQNIVHRQQLANTAFQIRNYSTWDMLETFSLMVQNRGEAKRADLMDIYAQSHIKAINTDVGVDSFHHGQAAVAGQISDDGVQRINGDDEAMNNGLDPGLVRQRLSAVRQPGSQRCRIEHSELDADVVWQPGRLVCRVLGGEVDSAHSQRAALRR
jgi:hypothetical protein